MKRIEIHVAPLAAIIGLALLGDHFAGGLGAGIALLLPVAILAAVAAADAPQYRRQKKTFRHRYLLFLDRSYRRRKRLGRERHERKETERRYIERRKA